MQDTATKKKTPVSWYIWLVIWIIPLIATFVTFDADPWGASVAIIGTGGLVILMLVKPKWVLPWFCVVFILDLLGMATIYTEEGTISMGSGYIGTLIKELIFLGYLLLSNNAKKHQGRFQANTKPAEAIESNIAKDEA